MTKIIKTVSGSVAAVALMAVLVSAYPVSTKAQFSNNAKNLAGLIAVDNITGGGSNGAFTGGNNDLADLIVLGGLFPTSTNANTNARDLAGLIAVDNIVGNNGGAFTKGNSDLASLLVLNGLFLDP